MSSSFNIFCSKFGSLYNANNYIVILFLRIISFTASPWISEVSLNYTPWRKPDLQEPVETPWIVAQLQTCLNVLVVLTPPGTCDYIIRADRNLNHHVHTIWYRASSSLASDLWVSGSSTSNHHVHAVWYRSSSSLASDMWVQVPPLSLRLWDPKQVLCLLWVSVALSGKRA